jgi:hypothetical protein
VGGPEVWELGLGEAVRVRAGGLRVVKALSPLSLAATAFSANPPSR